MEIKADVHSIAKLKDYFFMVPDYQREYVWKVDDQVEQFLVDIDNEFEEGQSEQKSYFIGSIIIVENKGRYDVIDGQQRLTTIVLTLCAFRDLLQPMELDAKQQSYFKTINEWLSDFDIETDETQIRLDLQYEESKDFLSNLILSKPYTDEQTSSIRRMQEAYETIKEHMQGYLNTGADNFTAFIRYFLSKIELVVIKSENLSSALKIFETINQRGAGLNAMDLVKNLIFSQAQERDFQKIKEKWKNIGSNLAACGEDQNQLRFLRYFIMARYYNGIIREDEIYKWIISTEGKKAIAYETNPLGFATELEKLSKRYSKLAKATMHQKDGGDYPAVTRIGFINKYKSRQHLVLLLALKVDCPKVMIVYLASQLESLFFYSSTLGIQAKNNERLFSDWAGKLREAASEHDLAQVVNDTILPYLKKLMGEFKQTFLNLRHYHYNPLYRQRYVLGQLENTLRRKSGFAELGLEQLNSLQIEHIFPQTPRDGVIPEEFDDQEDYESTLYMLGNVTLLEGTINQAINNFNDMNQDWFSQKQNEYDKSNVLTTALLNHEYSIGKNTQLNKFKDEYKYQFPEWNKAHVIARQKILLNLAFETWLINDKRIDESHE